MLFYARLFVPVTDNAGARFDQADWRTLEDRLVAGLGGFHIQGEVRGAWRSDAGRDYQEISRVYAVALESFRQVPEFLALAEWARRHFRQEAIFVEIAGQPETLGPR